MGTVFCNFRVMQWNTDTPLSQSLLQEQRIRESSKVGRDVEGLSSNRPELVVLRECLEAHEDHVHQLLEVGALKWCKEHPPRDGNDWTEEGQMLLDDPELWLDRLTFSWECHASRKRDRTTEDGTFLLHKKGTITSTFTGDWLLTDGESRDKLGEWLKKTQVRYQDQRRMLQSIMHCFPSNLWRGKITNGKESDKCDMCKSLWISQGRFTTESALPVQTLGHIQHTCEALSEIHTMAHHRCWCLIHRAFTTGVLCLALDLYE
jgi:hypothetical protein